MAKEDVTEEVTETKKDDRENRKRKMGTDKRRKRDGRTRRGKQPSSVESEDLRLKRTIFVGNVPVDTKPDALKKYFKRMGPIESVRMRSVAVEGTKVEEAGNTKAMRKACYITKKFNKEASSACNAYVVFRKAEDADRALALNGTVLSCHHLNVDRATNVGQSASRDVRKSVFIGNIKYDAADEQIWRWFGERVPGGIDSIERVRLVRDPATRVGKGIGYVTFKTPMAVLGALGLDGSEFEGRKMRVQRCKKTKGRQLIPNNKREIASAPRGSASKRPRTSKSSFEGERVTLKNRSGAMKRISRRQKRIATKSKVEKKHSGKKKKMKQK